MKKNSLLKSATAALALVWAGTGAWGASEDPSREPLPSGLPLKVLSDSCQVQIFFSYAGEKERAPAPPDAEPPPAMPRRVTFTRTQALWHAVLTDTAGKSSECWGDGSGRYLQLPSEKSPMLIDGRLAANMPLVCDFEKTDFPDMAWVSPATYVGLQKSDSTLVFRQGTDDGATVWIDVETRRPVRWQRNGETRRFECVSPAPEKLTLPPEIAEMAKIVQHLQDAGSHVPARHE